MDQPRDALRRRLLETFAVEAEEHLASLRSLLDTLEGTQPDRAGPVLEEAFRVMHTLKGASRSVGLKAIEQACHLCEGLLQRLAAGEISPTLARIQALARAVEAIAGLHDGSCPPEAVDSILGELREGAETHPSDDTASGPPADHAAAPRATPSTAVGGTRMRVLAERLDELIVQAEALHQPARALDERVRDMKSIIDELRALRSQARGQRTNGSAAVALDLAHPIAAIETTARRLLTRLAVDRRILRGGIDALLDGARGLRMTPVATILEAFPGMVRDLAEDEGKRIAWSLIGGEAELDRRVLDLMKDPLVHLVRNAIAHGAETPDERRSAGKPEAAAITVQVATEERGVVVIEVIDDGRGLDPAQIRKAAVERDVLSEAEAAALEDDRALDLIWASGFSTSPIISDLAGRGLGLAIVRDRVEGLGGRVALRSTLGKGTTVALSVPASVSLLEALHVRTRGRSFLLPAGTIDRVVRVMPADIRQSGGRSVTSWRDDDIVIGDLGDLLGIDEAPAGGEAPLRCVVLSTAGRTVGLLVDEVAGVETVLPRPLGPPLERVRNVAGAAVRATGEVALVLRAPDLTRSLEAGASVRRDKAASPAKAAPEVVLVVDDSATTRIMEKNLLEAAGYQVHLAKDGLEALDVLSREAVDVVVSDVDMPRMDGFELTERIRADPRLADVPVILVTALESADDKRRGIDVGASAYIVKSQFDESRLLDVVRRVV